MLPLVQPAKWYTTASFGNFSWWCNDQLPSKQDFPEPVNIIVNNTFYYSFKIFPLLWLVKTTRIIHHNQLLLTKFGKSFIMLSRWRQNEPLTVKIWGRGWVFWQLKQNYGTVDGTFYLFHGEILSKNMARTAWRRTTSAIWSIFADLNRPLSPKLPDKDALSIWTYIDQG